VVAGEAERILQLLCRGADVDARDGTPLNKTVLMTAAEQTLATGDAVLGMLLDSGASVGLTDLAGNTALHYAAASGVVTFVRRLLRCGELLALLADPSSPTARC
jgi:ankyrin repeat protein